MPIYELVTLTLLQGNMRNKTRLAEALASIVLFTGDGAAGGKLLGSWTAEFGPQNRIVLMRSFASADELYTERNRVLRCSDPFIPSAMLAGLSFESFVQFPSLPPISPGRYGPYYEFRTYVMRIGGLAPTIDAWAEAIPGRTRLSPLVSAMHALDGEPRFIHVWGYRNLAARERIRAEAFATGVWPARGAPEWLSENLKTELYVPTAISRLT